MYFLFGILIVTFGLAEASLVIGSPELLMSDTCFVPPCVGSSVAAPVDRARNGSDVASKCKKSDKLEVCNFTTSFCDPFLHITCYGL